MGLGALIQPTAGLHPNRTKSLVLDLNGETCAASEFPIDKTMSRSKIEPGEHTWHRRNGNSPLHTLKLAAFFSQPSLF